MAKNKTEFTDKNVDDFLQTVENEQKRKDSYELIALMEKKPAKKQRCGVQQLWVLVIIITNTKVVMKAMHLC